MANIFLKVKEWEIADAKTKDPNGEIEYTRSSFEGFGWKLTIDDNAVSANKENVRASIVDGVIQVYRDDAKIVDTKTDFAGSGVIVLACDSTRINANSERFERTKDKLGIMRVINCPKEVLNTEYIGFYGIPTWVNKAINLFTDGDCYVFDDPENEKKHYLVKNATWVITVSGRMKKHARATRHLRILQGMDIALVEPGNVKDHVVLNEEEYKRMLAENPVAEPVEYGVIADKR